MRLTQRLLIKHNRVKKFIFPRFIAVDIESEIVNNKQVEENDIEDKMNKKERKKVYLRAYRLKHKMELKEKKKEYDREYSMKNKERKKEYMREYDRMNKEKKKEYRLKNTEKRNQYDREYRLKNLEKHIQKKKENDENYVFIERHYHWKDAISLKTFFEKSAPLFGLNDLTGWYRVSNAQIRKAGGDGLLKSYTSLGFALKVAYPEYPWIMSKFSLRNKKAAQRWLAALVKRLVSESNSRSNNASVAVEEDYRKDPHLRLEGSHRNLELDIFLPQFNLALEFHGEQHYKEFSPSSGFLNLAERQKSDSEKKKICEANGITLVCIPFWWDETVESLTSTLNQYVPDVFPASDSPPIPSEMPLDFKNTRKLRPRSNNNMMHGYDYDPNNEINVEGWFMSEKLDGMRAYWDGKQFWSKNGVLINLPESFKALPSYPLDGELWGGYEETNVNYLLKLICGKKKKVKIDWTAIKFCVFDAPDIDATYDKRHDFLRTNFTEYCNSNISLIPIQKCDGKNHLEKYLEEIINKGGEGIMIHHPDLLYRPGRTHNLLKVKKHFESVVTFLNVKSDSYYFLCEQENGAEAFVTCTPAEYSSPPTFGTKLTVRHQGFFAKSQKYKYPILYVKVNTVKPQNSANIKRFKNKKKAKNNAE